MTLSLQVDETNGSAAVGLRDYKIQERVATPRAVWNPDFPNPIDFVQGWQTVPTAMNYDNGFKIQWEMFLRAVQVSTAPTKLRCQLLPNTNSSVSVPQGIPESVTVSVIAWLRLGNSRS